MPGSARLGDKTLSAPGVPDGPAVAFVRPHDVVLAPSGARPGGDALLPGDAVVRFVSKLGNRASVELSWRGRLIRYAEVQAVSTAGRARAHAAVEAELGEGPDDPESEGRDEDGDWGDEGVDLDVEQGNEHAHAHDREADHGAASWRVLILTVVERPGRNFPSPPASASSAMRIGTR